MTSPLGSSCGGGGGAGDGLSSRSCEGGLAALAASQRRTAAVASIAAGRNGKIEVRECPEVRLQSATQGNNCVAEDESQ